MSLFPFFLMDATASFTSARVDMPVGNIIGFFFDATYSRNGRFVRSPEPILYNLEVFGELVPLPTSRGDVTANPVGKVEAEVVDVVCCTEELFPHAESKVSRQIKIIFFIHTS